MAHSQMQDDPKHWRRLAQSTRAAADQLRDPEARKTLRDIADDYEQLAALAETKDVPNPSR